MQLASPIQDVTNGLPKSMILIPYRGHSMREPEIQPLVTLIGCSGQVRFLFFLRHTVPFLLSLPGYDQFSAYLTRRSVRLTC